MDWAIVIFSCATGLRPEEVYGLEWRDIDRGHRLIHVQRFWVKGKLEDAGKTPGVDGRALDPSSTGARRAPVAYGLQPPLSE
jgi:integrase